MRAVRSTIFGLALLLVGVLAQAQFIVKQSTGYTIALPDIIASSDHIAGLTGQTGTVYLARITGSTGAVTKAASTNNIVEVDSANAPGKYTLAITSSETSALGFIQGYYKAASSDPVGFTVKVVAFDPDDAAALGLSRVDAAISSRMATFTLPTNFSTLGIDGSGRVILQPVQTGVTIPNVTTVGGLGPPANWNLLTISGAGLLSDTPGLTTLLTRIPGTVQPQTGDAYARLGAPAGASVSADIAANTASLGTLTTRVPGVVQPQTGDSYARLGAPNGASISADIAAVAASTVTQVLAATVDGSITLKQSNALMLSIIGGKYSIVRDANAKTITVTYYRVDRATTLAVMVTNYSDTALTIAASRPTITWSNLP